MKKLIPFFAILFCSCYATAQVKTTTSAVVSFDATTPLDALPKANNNAVIGSLNTKSGAVNFEATVKNFSFANPKMQEHFNGANWMNSDQFPKFTFTGNIEKFKKVKWTKDGSNKVAVTGVMTVKGIAKNLKTTGTIKIAGGKITINTEFTIILADYNITGQPITAGKVSKEPKINVTAEF
jgi:polyisoprenoid-binding protein YceI